MQRIASRISFLLLIGGISGYIMGTQLSPSTSQWYWLALIIIVPFTILWIWNLLNSLVQFSSKTNGLNFSKGFGAVGLIVSGLTLGYIIGAILGPNDIVVVLGISFSIIALSFFFFLFLGGRDGQNEGDRRKRSFRTLE